MLLQRVARAGLENRRWRSEESPLASVEARLVLVLVLPCVALALGAAGLAATASPAPTLDATTILQRSESRWQGLSSYQVPITISVIGCGDADAVRACRRVKLIAAYRRVQTR